jgi:hypothetical protein
MQDLPDDHFLVVIGYAIDDHGDYLENLKQYISDNKMENKVAFYGTVPAQDILSTIADCDVGVAFYGRSNLNDYYCAPNKVYNYFMAGVTVITNNYPTLEHLKEYEFVRLLDNVTPHSISESIQELTTLNPHISDGVKQQFSWDRSEHIFMEIYKG